MNQFHGRPPQYYPTRQNHEIQRRSPLFCFFILFPFRGEVCYQDHSGAEEEALRTFIPDRFRNPPLHDHRWGKVIVPSFFAQKTEKYLYYGDRVITTAIQGDATKMIDEMDNRADVEADGYDSLCEGWDDEYDSMFGGYDDGNGAAYDDGFRDGRHAALVTFSEKMRLVEMAVSGRTELDEGENDG